MEIPVHHYDAPSAEKVQHLSAEQQQASTTNTTTSSMPPNNLANTKEKTPMCLMNELVQYNQIQHQYRLTGEQGPAHKKHFTVTLKLGNKEYEAEGASIKEAQHSAAAMALQQTDFKHPPPKITQKNRSSLRNGSGIVTPTVELNALAMKRRERTVYVLENEAPAPQAQGYMSQRSYQHPPGEPFSIRLRVGEREYPGMGNTVQAARHDAAAKAIEDIKQKEMDDGQQCLANGEPVVLQNDVCNDLSTELKSPISLVHEIALKRKLNVAFTVLSEEGPPHMKVFITQCRVGDFETEEEGNCKKTSKKRAAEKMLEELSKLGPLRNISTGVGPNKEIEKCNAVETLLGYANTPAPQFAPEPVLKVEKEVEPVEKPCKVTFMENSASGGGGRQLVPELLLVNDQSGVIQQEKAKLGGSEMLNSGSWSTPTETKKMGQVQVPKKSPQVIKKEQ